MDKFYLTTTLPYVNASPHIGFALEIVQADALARYRQQQGKKVFFNTGTDEHGLKIYLKAQEEKKDPQEYVNEYAARFDRLKKALDLSYNNFIRTTDPHHITAAQEFWRRCQKNGDIYSAKQKINYCVGCEMEKTDSELIDGRCPLHPNREMEIMEEENYFFRFSRYQKPLLDFYENNPEFVVPGSRYREIKNFVAGGLKDFSISRRAQKMPWGIPVPDDSQQVMYVWFDALINYISALGWPENEKQFADWWPGTQVAGKDNLRQQTAMWQAMLMSAGLPNSAQIFIHGFITADGQKMSKSLGNVIDPFDLVKDYGTEAVRYYLLREIPPFQDGDFSRERFEQLYNADLANGLGNLVQRLAKMAQKIGLGKLKTREEKAKIENELKHFHFDQALAKIWKEVTRLDQEISQTRPWEKTGTEAERALKKFIEGDDGFIGLITIANWLEPFLPATGRKIKEIFSADQIQPPEAPLFPRL